MRAEFAFALLFVPPLVGGCTPPEEVRTFEFALQVPAADGALGSVFTFTSADGSVSCGAGFVTASGTRYYGNFNDLEFWCRSARGSDRLRWRRLSRPYPDFPSTAVTNLDGRAIDWMSQWELSFDSGYWVDSDGREDVPRGIPLGAQGQWVFAHGRDGCPGLSVHSDAGYHGTVATDSALSAAVVWRGAVYVNFDNRVWRASVPDAPTAEACRVLSASVHVDEPVNVYTMLPVGDRLFIGGGGRPYINDPRTPCAPLFVSDGVEVQRVELAGCQAQDVTEFYALTLWQDALVVGTYPDGNLYRIDLATLDTRRLDVPIAGSAHGRYHESQSLAIAAGRLTIGVFPWGEVYRGGGDRWSVQRLFTTPRRTHAPQPYGAAAEALRCPDRDSACLAQLDGFEYWNQRVTSLAVFDGRLCAGTGNTYATRYDPDEHAFVSETDAARYGRVHCAPLRNQTLATAPPRSGNYAFRVDRRRLTIFRDGEMLASRPHELKRKELESLASGPGVLVVGEGPYGPSQTASIARR